MDSFSGGEQKKKESEGTGPGIIKKGWDKTSWLRKKTWQGTKWASQKTWQGTKWASQKAWSETLARNREMSIRRARNEAYKENERRKQEELKRQQGLEAIKLKRERSAYDLQQKYEAYKFTIFRSNLNPDKRKQMLKAMYIIEGDLKKLGTSPKGQSPRDIEKTLRGRGQI